jgi:hypothetical protein
MLRQTFVRQNMELSKNTDQSAKKLSTVYIKYVIIYYLSHVQQNLDISASVLCQNY